MPAKTARLPASTRSRAVTVSVPLVTESVNVVLELRLPVLTGSPLVTAPTPWSTAAVPPGPASKIGVSVELPPGPTLGGDALKLVTVGIKEFENVTVAWAVDTGAREPTVLVAVRLYMVVAAGLTAIVPLAATVPIPLSILTLVAPTTFQLKVLVCPLLIVDGIAVKLRTVGGATTVTVAVAVVWSSAVLLPVMI
jgi:hypothetical protein